MNIDLSNYTTFGNLLQKLCKSKGVTIREASKSLNMSPAYLCEIQKGDRKPPKHETLLQIFEYFKIDELQQEELLDLIYLEKQKLRKASAEFLQQNKQAAKIIKQITKIKDFDKIILENPELLSNLQLAIDELTLVYMEKNNENRF